MPSAGCVPAELATAGMPAPWGSHRLLPLGNCASLEDEVVRMRTPLETMFWYVP
jgi:hypothetical protein